MKFEQTLIEGILIKRYKRFLADIELKSGGIVTAHCANPGAMLGLRDPGSRVWLSISDNPKRKLKYSWELVEADSGSGPTLVGINTSHPNKIVAEAIMSAKIEGLTGYDSQKREVRYGQNSRIDILLEGNDRPPCYVEIKNVHFMRQNGLAEFPDSVTARGAKHLDELSAMAEQGARAVMIYLIQRADAEKFTFAGDLDPHYLDRLMAASAQGVEALAYRCRLTPVEITLTDRVELEL